MDDPKSATDKILSDTIAKAVSYESILGNIPSLDSMQIFGFCRRL